MSNKFGLIRYPGSKAKLHPHIMRQIPDEIALGLWSNAREWEYREPFFGSGAIGFRVMESLSGNCKVWLNDKDYWLVCLWNSVKDTPRELMKLVMDFTPSPDNFFEFKLQDGKTDVDPLIAGFRKLALHQMSVSGFGVMSGSCLGGKNQDNAEYPVDCRWSPVRLCEHIKNRHKQMKRFGHRLKITCKDFSRLLRNCSTRSFVYLDPPYWEKGQVLYKHGMKEADHIRLAREIKRLRCDWVLSYDDHPSVRDLYEGCQIEEVSVTYSNATHAKGLRPKNKEILIMPPCQVDRPASSIHSTMESAQ